MSRSTLASLGWGARRVTILLTLADWQLIDREANRRGLLPSDVISNAALTFTHTLREREQSVARTYTDAQGREHEEADVR